MQPGVASRPPVSDWGRVEPEQPGWAAVGLRAPRLDIRAPFLACSGLQPAAAPDAGALPAGGPLLPQDCRCPRGVNASSRARSSRRRSQSHMSSTPRWWTMGRRHHVGGGWAGMGGLRA